jgi:DNA-binding MarR family transcriptional regulator
MVALDNQPLAMGFYARKLYETYADPLLKRHDLRFVELQILALLAQSDGEDCARELVRTLRISKAHISKSMDRLTQRGLVYRTEDPDDHRVHHVHLTDQGRQVAIEFLGIKNRCRSIMFQGVSQQEMVTVRQVARQMISNTVEALKSLHPDQKATR